MALHDAIAIYFLLDTIQLILAPAVELNRLTIHVTDLCVPVIDRMGEHRGHSHIELTLV